MRRFAIALLILALPAMALAGPSIVGSMNGWNPADPAYDVAPLGSGYFFARIFDAGSYEYKVVEGDEWGNDFPWFNIPLEVPAQAEVTFFVNLGATVGVTEGDEYVAHQAPIIAGNFIDEFGGNEWDPADPTGMMTQIAGTDLFVLEGALPAGVHECKVTLNGNWDQNTAPDGNFIFELTAPAAVIFTYEFGTNTLTVDEATAVENIGLSNVKALY